MLWKYRPLSADQETQNMNSSSRIAEAGADKRDLVSSEKTAMCAKPEMHARSLSTGIETVSLRY